MLLNGGVVACLLLVDFEGFLVQKRSNTVLD